MKRLKILGLIFGVLIILSLTWNSFVHFRFHFKPIVNFLVKISLENSCKGKSDCEEFRPLPKIFQGKKIVFNENTNIEFEPYSSESQIKISELDIIGSIDATRISSNKDEIFIDPTLFKRGFLKEREYKIIRAVYEYKCYYCVDSSDLAYLVLEDSSGNRFMALLKDIDFSTSPGRTLSWEEYNTYFLGKDIVGNELNLAKLENI